VRAKKACQYIFYSNIGYNAIRTRTRINDKLNIKVFSRFDTNNDFIISLKFCLSIIK